MLLTMVAPSEVTPNRRGVRSRALVLDAAERIMAKQGYEAATLARVVEESGIPMSSVYHFFGSKERILLAVMERGCDRFFDDLPNWDTKVGRPADHLALVISTTAANLERHPNFLRLLIALAAQPLAGEGSEVHAVVRRVRDRGLAGWRTQLALAFGDDRHSETTDRLATFALAAFDGAFVATQIDPEVSLARILQPLAGALVAVRRALTV
jgi:AcrR family transcriptional regulator